MTEQNLLTITELRAIAPDLDLSRYDDPTISGMITGASEMVAQYLGYSPLAEDVVDELKEAKVTTDGDLLIFPGKLPVQSLASVKISKGSVDLDLELTTIVNGTSTPKYNIDYNRRSIVIPYAELTFDGSLVMTNLYALRSTKFYVKMNYRAGYEVSELPMSIKQAVALYVRDLTSRQYNTTGAIEVQQGGIRLRYGESDGKSDSIKDAERLLNPYARIG